VSTRLISVARVMLQRPGKSDWDGLHRGLWLVWTLHCVLVVSGLPESHQTGRNACRIVSRVVECRYECEARRALGQ
jgi:hypothetical protein